MKNKSDKSIRISDEDYKRIDAATKIERRTKKTIMSLALDKYFKKLKKVELGSVQSK